MAASRKKVIIRSTTGIFQFGYLPVNGLVAGSGEEAVVDLLDLEGRIVLIPFSSVRWVAYVRDFNRDDGQEPEGLVRRTFLARPRIEGLWMRLTLVGGEVLEGLGPLDLTLLDGLVADQGVYLVPPDARSNTQRVFVPRHAMVDVRVVAVVTSPSKAVAVAPKKVTGVSQDSLFPG